jgi:hypothetical protein
MRWNHKLSFRNRTPHTPSQNAIALAKTAGHGVPLSKRARTGRRDPRLPFAPPEDWHEPSYAGKPYRVIVQDPGPGFRHVVTPAEVRQRLDQLPPEFVRPLEVLQFSRMTRKKQSFPCYGMQWGSSLYLYPIEEGLVEYYDQPPKPSQLVEARMYGGRWVQEGRSTWTLVWTEEAIKDFYLNNILIHELGHLVDDRNSSYMDRERFAEWFAVQHGYLSPTRRTQTRTPPVRRRHHAK